jgi:DNA-binding beta-propeller fold protein YncE
LGRAQIGITIGCAVAAMACAGPPPARAGGQLFQFDGLYGCASSLRGQGCASSRALEGASSVARSADGRSVYVASAEADAVATFVRNRRDGRVVQPRNLNGCVSTSGLDGCFTGAGLRGAFGVTVSPGDRNVYAVSNNSIAIFDRNNQGSLTQPIGVNGCISEFSSEGCALGRALQAGSDVAVSPDGRHVYVAAAGSDAVAAFGRDPGGTLSQLPGTDGCVNVSGAEGCAAVRALRAPQSIAISPSGTHMYVTSRWANAVAVLARDPITGALTQDPGGAGCISEGGTDGCRIARGIEHPNGLAIAPDGEHLYVASSGSETLTAFGIDPSGGLDQLAGKRGCIGERALPACERRASLADAYDVAVGPDGRSVYAIGSAAVTYLHRRRRGDLRALGCVSADGRFDCRDGRGLINPASITVGPGGEEIYVASEVSDSLATLTRRGHVKVRISGVPKHCVRGRFSARVHADSTLALRRVKVFRDGRGPQVESLKRSSRLRLRISAAQLRRRGRHTLVVRAYDVSGASDRARATFRRC